jgi:hypothetical protein
MPTTANMSLVLPTVSSTLGPDWATLLNAALTLVDTHDHSSGKGVKVTPTGLNLNANVTLNDFYLTDVGSMRLTSLGATLVTPSDVGSIYNVNGNLYWNNDAGTAVQLTSGGSPVAASDGVSRAFERSSVNANTIISAAGTVSYYDVDTTSSVTFTLPAANGVSAGRFYEIKDTTGSAGTNNIVINRAGADTIDGATSFTINLNYGAVRLVSDGTSKWAVIRTIADTDNIRDSAVTTGKINNLAVTTAKIDDLAVTQGKRAALGQQLSASCGSFSTTSGSATDVTNLSVTITTTGRPVFVGVFPDGAGFDGVMGATLSVNAIRVNARFYFKRDATLIAQTTIMSNGASGDIEIDIPSSNFWIIDVPAAGTYTYKMQAQILSANTTAWVRYTKLIAYEL